MVKVSKKILSVFVMFSVLLEFIMPVYAENTVNGNTKPGKKAVIVVPGIGGSELFSAKEQRVRGVNYEKGYRFWPPDCITPFFDSNQKLGTEDFSNVKLEDITEDIKLICCKSSGESKVEMMASNPVLDCRSNLEKRNFGIVNCYKKVVKNIIKSTNPDEYDVVFFSYDWRQDNKNTALELEKMINEQNYKSVTFVGHSMGCLVCAHYLTKPENKAKLERAIFMGAPFLGAPKAFSVMSEGKFVDGLIGEMLAPLINPILRDITRNCKSLYELLPPKQYFDIMKQGYLKSCDIKGNITDIDNYEDTLDAICYEIGGKYIKEHLEEAQQFYDTLFKDGEFVLCDDDLNVYNILGVNRETPAQIIINEKTGNKELKQNGDGMVTVQSSLIGDALNKKPTYYLKGVSHLGLLTNKYCIKLMRKILKYKNNIHKMNPHVVATKIAE